MDVKINVEHLEEYIKNGNLKVDNITFQKMLLIFNALDDGWSIKKRDSSYVFSKNHEGKKEVLEETYLLKFMKNNFDLKKILSY
jgi:hypothetical protein